ncbi:AbiU2 domain-containing protein [Pseudomonas sp. RL_5y_Pfl2_73]|uniref:AbiU2 domain-containing protein n=1 Tax=Pseudomonas sp. RL_5y_Pfl2_73 TaxID=3088713 RepID=UPI0030D711DB
MIDTKIAAKEVAFYLSYLADIKREVVLFEQLYCVIDSVSVLNATAPEQFKIIRKSMFVSILTRMAAMLDRPEFGKRDNFSLSYLAKKYQQHLNDELNQHQVDIENRFEALGATQFRHKMIAHNDYKAVFGEEDYSHEIGEGDLPELIDSMIEYCLLLLDSLPGSEGISLQAVPYELQPGKDGVELVRRLRATIDEQQS